MSGSNEEETDVSYKGKRIIRAIRKSDQFERSGSNNR